MQSVNIYIQVIVNDTGMHFSVVEKILEAAATHKRNYIAAGGEDWEGGKWSGLVAGLVIAGANETVIDQAIKELS